MKVTIVHDGGSTHPAPTMLLGQQIEICYGVVEGLLAGDKPMGSFQRSTPKCFSGELDVPPLSLLRLRYKI